MPASPRFSLEAEDGSSGSFVHAAGLEGQLNRCVARSPRRFISLLDGRIFGPLASPPRDSPSYKPASTNASLTILDNSGNHLFSHFLGPVSSCRAFGLGQNGAVSELVLSATDLEPLPPGTSEVLASWSDGIPTIPNQWSSLSFHGRRAWLRAVSARSSRHSSPQRDTRHHYTLDSASIIDYPGIFLALGEAINGPCGYYGSNLDSVEDCLTGGYGPIPPFTLEWRSGNVRLSRDAWVRENFWRKWETHSEQHDESPATPDVLSALFELLREHSVDIVFDER